MKKSIVFLLALVLCLAVPITAAAAYENIWELYEEWDSAGYPDYVSMVYSTEGTMEKLTVVLVEGQEVMENELRRLVEDEQDLTVRYGGKVSHTRLQQLQEEIISRYMKGGEDPGQMVYIGIGADVNAGQPYLAVGVLAPAVETFTDLFRTEYGDLVRVEKAGPITTLEDQLNGYGDVTYGGGFTGQVGEYSDGGGETGIFPAVGGSPESDHGGLIALGAAGVCVLGLVGFFFMQKVRKKVYVTGGTGTEGTRPSRRALKQMLQGNKVQPDKGVLIRVQQEMKYRRK